MCGLWGMAGPGITKGDLDAMEDLGVVNSLRGTDGMGVCFGSTHNYNKGSPKILRLESDPLGFFWNLDKTRDKPDENLGYFNLANNYYMYHTRHATVGDVNKENVHPFVFDDVIGMHNGTLDPDDKEVDMKPDDREFNTDSEALIYALNQYSFDTVLNKIKKGAYAVTFLSKANKKIHLAHNSKRPLAFALNKMRGVMYWSSEYGALEYILDRCKFQYQMFTVPTNKIWVVDPKDIRSYRTDNDQPWTTISLEETSREVTRYVNTEHVNDFGMLNQQHLV